MSWSSELVAWLQIDGCVHRKCHHDEEPVPCASNIPCTVSHPDTHAVDADRVGESCGKPFQRDRTKTFSKLRKLHQSDISHPDRAGNREESSPSSSRKVRISEHVHGASRDLKSIYDQTVEVHASLAAKLAHHNGIKQFGLEFPGRVPPIDFRLLLPQLEASIEREVTALVDLRTKLEDSKFQSEDHIRQVHANALQWLNNLHSAAQITFADQQRQMQDLAQASPQFSTALCPIKALGTKLSEKLVSSIGSPTGSPLAMESMMTDCPSDLSNEAKFTMELEEVESCASGGEDSDSGLAFASVFAFGAP